MAKALGVNKSGDLHTVNKSDLHIVNKSGDLHSKQWPAWILGHTE